MKAKMSLCVTCRHVDKSTSIDMKRAITLVCKKVIHSDEYPSAVIGDKKFNGQEFPWKKFAVPHSCPYILEHTLL